MSGFDYHYTCPDIDKLIVEAKDNIESHIHNILVELCPPISEFCNLPKELQDWVESTTESLYEDLEGVFEGARSSNEDMRSAADLQVRELESELEDALQEIKLHEEG